MFATCVENNQIFVPTSENTWNYESSMEIKTSLVTSVVRVTQPSNIYKFTRANIPVRNLIAVRNVEKQLTKVCKGRQHLPKVATSSQKLASEYLKIRIASECLRMPQNASECLRKPQTISDHLGTLPDNLGTLLDHLGTLLDHLEALPDQK